MLLHSCFRRCEPKPKYLSWLLVVHVRPHPYPVAATPQVSVSRSASPAHWLNSNREVLTLGSWAALASGASGPGIYHDRGAGWCRHSPQKKERYSRNECHRGTVKQAAAPTATPPPATLPPGTVASAPGVTPGPTPGGNRL